MAQDYIIVDLTDHETPLVWNGDGWTPIHAPGKKLMCVAVCHGMLDAFLGLFYVKGKFPDRDIQCVPYSENDDEPTRPTDTKRLPDNLLR